MNYSAELYDRQATLQLDIPASLTVAGCGGIGYWLGLLGAISGIKQLYLLDDDTVQPSNLNRLPIRIADVGKYKVDVLAEHISSVRPEALVYPLHSKATPVMLSATAGVVMDCTDKLAAQRQIFDWCHKNSRQYMKMGYSGGTHITVADAPPIKLEEEEDDGYGIVPSWTVPAALTACLGLFKLLKQKNFRLSKEVKEL